MRFYGQKFVKSFMDKKVRSFIEGRDALVWEVLETDRTCKVRIQGSNRDIIAKFPQNMKTIPSWLRKGNSVQIAHRGGVRGYVYIVGQGTTIPSILVGEPLPDPGKLPDAVLTGGKITATEPPTMGVQISSGTFRIDDVEYSFSSVGNTPEYDQTPEIFYDTPPEIFYDIEISEYIDPAPVQYYFRYDAFCVGTDGVIDYVKGIESLVPVKPVIPNNHLLVDVYILVVGGVTTIEQKYIGMEWTPPEASSMVLNIAGAGISYTLPYDNAGTFGDTGDDPQYKECNIVFSILDQYNNPKTGARTLVLTKVAGDGDFWSNTTGYHDTTVSQYITGSSYTFKYRREQLLDTGTVVFIASTVNGANTLELVGIINLGVDTA